MTTSIQNACLKVSVPGCPICGSDHLVTEGNLLDFADERSIGCATCHTKLKINASSDNIISKWIKRQKTDKCPLCGGMVIGIAAAIGKTEYVCSSCALTIPAKSWHDRKILSYN